MSPEVSGVGTAGTRTQDQSLKRALLYQLSYRPKEARMIAELVRRSTENDRRAWPARVADLRSAQA